jgi:hypothetical protein
MIRLIVVAVNVIAALGRSSSSSPQTAGRRGERPRHGPPRLCDHNTTTPPRLRVPDSAKLAIVFAGLRVLSPIDLIPEFLPVIGGSPANRLRVLCR